VVLEATPARPVLLYLHLNKHTVSRQLQLSSK
jgi:hypothetical protein